MREALESFGLPPWQADGVIEDYEHYRRGEAARVDFDGRRPDETDRRPFFSSCKTMREDSRKSCWRFLIATTLSFTAPKRHPWLKLLKLPSTCLLGQLEYNPRHYGQEEDEHRGGKKRPRQRGGKSRNNGSCRRMP